MQKAIRKTIGTMAVWVALTTGMGCALPFGAHQTSEEQVVVVTTEKGTFVIELYPDSAPVTVENFKKLVKQRFYDG